MQKHYVFNAKSFDIKCNCITFASSNKFDTTKIEKREILSNSINALKRYGYECLHD